MLSAVKSWNDSAQSPAWSRKASPAATSASARCRLRASPAKTSGGRPDRVLRVCSRACGSGQSGCWSAGQVPPSARGPGPVHEPPAWRKPRHESKAVVRRSRIVRRSWVSGSGSSEAPSIPSTSAIWWPRSTPRHALRLDRVIMMVANVPWQKAGDRAVSSAEDRLALVAAAVGRRARARGGRLEIDRGGESYTADTLAEMHQADPEDELFLIVGWDVAADLTTWERYEEIQRLATLVVVNRPGSGRPARPRRRRLEGGGGHRSQPGDLEHRPAGPGRRRPPARLSGPGGSSPLHPSPGYVRWGRMTTVRSVPPEVAPLTWTAGPGRAAAAPAPPAAGAGGVADGRRPVCCPGCHPGGAGVAVAGQRSAQQSSAASSSQPASRSQASAYAQLLRRSLRDASRQARAGEHRIAIGRPSST